MLRTTLLVLPLLLTGNAVADAQAVGHRVKVNGMQMYYEVSGRGDRGVDERKAPGSGRLSFSRCVPRSATSMPRPAA